MSLPDGTRMGRVRLRVADLRRSLAFYGDLIGLHVLGRENGRAALSAAPGGEPLLVLEALPGTVPRPRYTLGLYHFAILFPSRRELARSVARLARAGWPFHGFSDHGVSEAVYLADPDGNGVELYVDRPRDRWPFRNGRLAMVTRPLDLQGLLAELGPDPEAALDSEEGPAPRVDPVTRIGHVHLHVSDLAQAEAFYAGALGFEVTQRDYPGALFLAAGGYHHHLGANIWAGAGPAAPRPPAGAAGLLDFGVVLPGGDALTAAVRRLERAGRPVERSAEGWRVPDPDGNVVVLYAPEVAGAL